MALAHLAIPCAPVALGQAHPAVSDDERAPTRGERRHAKHQKARRAMRVSGRSIVTTLLPVIAKRARIAALRGVDTSKPRD